MPASPEDDSFATLRPDQRVRSKQPEVTGEKDTQQALTTADSAEGGPIPAARQEAPFSPSIENSVVAGTHFGDYEILEEIARGGMGLVVKARQKKLNRVVALKMILAGKLADEDDVKRFYTEAEASADLDHAYIVPIYEIGQVDGLHYYSMRFVDGLSLQDRIKDGPLPADEAARFSQQISEAVAYAHERNILHRDLKPANILIDSDNDPLVTDFGLAKRLDDDQGITGTGQVIGTPGYMPPEQAIGNIRAITPASDIYSLGAILYCLLTGRAPFQASSIMETLAQVTKNEPVGPRQLNPTVPVDLETICLKCLSKESAQRYATAQELADDLSRYLEGSPVLARPVGGLRRFGRWCRRNPVVAYLSFTAAAALIAGTIVSTMFGFAAANRAREAEANFKLAREAVDDYFTQVSENRLLNQPGMQTLQQDLLRQALSYYEQFLVEHANAPDIQDDLAAANFRVGLINEKVEANPAKAIAPLQSALMIQQQLVDQTPRDEDRRAALADTMTALGRIRFRNEGAEAAIEILKSAASIRLQLAADHSGPGYHRVVANSMMNVGLAYMDLGQFSEARRQFESAQKQRRELLQSDRNPLVLRDLGMGHYNLGNLALSGEAADNSEAFSQFAAAIKVFTEVVQADPRDFTNQAHLALCYRILGDLQNSQEAIDEALNSYSKSGEILRKLVALNPRVNRYRVELASLEMNQGHLFVAAEKPTSAYERFKAAHALWKSLESESDNIDAARNHAVSLREIALIEIHQGDEAAGRGKFAHAEEKLEQLAIQNPDDEDVRIDWEFTSDLREQLGDLKEN